MTTTTNEAPEVWRVECEGGEVRSVEAWRQGIVWRAERGSIHGTALDVVAEVAAWQRWPVVAVLAPGQPTRAEVGAERDALRSRARRATQAIIAEVGADGPMDVDEAAGRIVARLGAVTQERDALLALLAAAACGELPRCDCWHGCARLAAQEATEGETAWSCDECLAKHEAVSNERDARGGWRDLPHAAALRAAMGGAK